MPEKPYSQSCENNKTIILEHLSQYFAESSKVLEIGSGTGQHAVYFAPNLAHLEWHCADQREYHDGINAWISEFPSPNLRRPIELSFPNVEWPPIPFDGIFSANTAHIMQMLEVKSMMQTVQNRLPSFGVFCQYGPFKINNKFNSQSNVEFHEKLISIGCGGYRDISELQNWAPLLTLEEIKQMPANNLLLIWRKKD